MPRILRKRSRICAITRAKARSRPCSPSCTGVSTAMRSAPRSRTGRSGARGWPGFSSSPASLRPGPGRAFARFNEWIDRMREAGREPAMPAAGERRARPHNEHTPVQGAGVPRGLPRRPRPAVQRGRPAPGGARPPRAGPGPQGHGRRTGHRISTLARTAVANRLRREQLGEELRLLYVAMTRARERLIMTCAVKDPEKYAGKLAAAAESPMPAEPLLNMRSFSDWLVTAALADRGRTFMLRLDPRAARGRPAPRRRRRPRRRGALRPPP